jgi:hypothetical protein
VQLADLLLFQDLVAIESILKSFELRLQMLDSRLELLQPVLPTAVWRPPT